MRQAAGFTLLEALITMTVLSIVAGMVAVFIRAPIAAYVDTARRAALTDIADASLRRFDREIRMALPNSIRIAENAGVTYIEFLQTSGAGRYRAAAASPGVGDALDFTAVDNSFDVLGAQPDVPANAQLVIMNLGVGSGADAYAGDNRSAIQSLSGGTLKFAPFLFPYESPSKRFFVVAGAVSYACDPTAGTLRRYSGYPLSSAQQTPPTGANAALVANKVSACSFGYDQVASRTGMVSTSLTLSSGGESVHLFHQVAVSSSP